MFIFRLHLSYVFKTTHSSIKILQSVSFHKPHNNRCALGTLRCSLRIDISSVALILLPQCCFARKGGVCRSIKATE